MRKPWAKIRCLKCDKVFRVIRSRRDKAKFCSKKCVIVSENTKLKLSKAQRGIPKTEEWKRKMSLSKLAEKNPLWKGDNAGLDAIHIWVHKRFPKPPLCQACKSRPPIDMANISQKYSRDIADWEWLCRRCHMIKDGRIKNLKQFRA